MMLYHKYQFSQNDIKLWTYCTYKQAYCHLVTFQNWQHLGVQSLKRFKIECLETQAKQE